MGITCSPCSTSMLTRSGLVSPTDLTVAVSSYVSIATPPQCTPDPPSAANPIVRVAWRSAASAFLSLSVSGCQLCSCSMTTLTLCTLTHWSSSVRNCLHAPGVCSPFALKVANLSFRILTRRGAHHAHRGLAPGVREGGSKGIRGPRSSRAPCMGSPWSGRGRRA